MNTQTLAKSDVVETFSRTTSVRVATSSPAREISSGISAPITTGSAMRDSGTRLRFVLFLCMVAYFVVAASVQTVHTGLAQVASFILP